MDIEKIVPIARKVNKSVGSSAEHGCSFWKVEGTDDVFITNYNVFSNKPLDGYVMVFHTYKANGQIVRNFRLFSKETFEIAGEWMVREFIKYVNKVTNESRCNRT